MGKKLSIFAAKLASDRYYLKDPVMNFDSDEGSTNDIIYGATGVQGWRRRQEDKYKCMLNLIPGYNYFAVFDGHGGPEVAEYLQKELHNFIFNNLTEDDVELALYTGFLSCDYSLRDPLVLEELKLLVENQNSSVNEISCTDETAESLPGTSGENLVSRKKDFVPLSESSESEGEEKTNESQLDISGQNKSSDDDDEEEEEEEPDASQSIKKVMDVLSFLTNDELAESEDDDDSDFTCEEDEEEEEEPAFDVAELAENEKDDDTFRPGFDSGSTATVVITAERMIYMANVGDSRCVLSSKGKAIDMSLDHKPEDEEEKKRIISAGAKVVGDRIDSMLNLSRAFGDFNFKKETLDDISYSVIAEPFILQIPRTIEMDFIILASDGIWNSMDSQAVVDFVSLRLSCGAKPKHISEELCHLIVAEEGDGNDDGTGKDNMSCIIILFNGYQNKVASAPEIETDNVIPLQKDPENDEVVYLFETKTSKPKNSKLCTPKLSEFPNCNEGHEDHDSVQKEDTEEKICSENVIPENSNSDAAVMMKTATGESSDDYEYHSKDSYDCNSSDAVGTMEQKVSVNEGIDCLSKTAEKPCELHILQKTTSVEKYTSGGEPSEDDPSCEEQAFRNNGKAEEMENSAEQIHVNVDDNKESSEDKEMSIEKEHDDCKGIKRSCEELQNASKKLKEQ